MKRQLSKAIGTIGCWVCAMTATPGATAASVILLSNLDQPTFPSSTVVGLNQFPAAPFITGDSPAVFHDATIPLMAFASSFGNFWVGLYHDAGGVPGSLLAGGILSGPDSPRVSGHYTYWATTEVVLSPNTRYWLAAHSDFATPNANYGWYDSMTFDYDSPAGWQLPGYIAFSSDGGATWRSTEDALEPRPFKLAITGSIVPEPASIALFGLGATVLVMSRRKV